MHFSILLFALSKILKVASFTNRKFKHYIRNANVRVLIKTADGKHARLFIFKKGSVYSAPGDHKDYDVALIWKDAATGFSVMTSKKPDASFNAAARKKLWVRGVSFYAQWFEDAVKLVM